MEKLTIEEIEQAIGLDLETVWTALNDGVWYKFPNGYIRHFTNIALYKYHGFSLYYGKIHFNKSNYLTTWALTKQELQ